MIAGWRDGCVMRRIRNHTVLNLECVSESLPATENEDGATTPFQTEYSIMSTRYRNFFTNSPLELVGTRLLPRM